MKFRNFFFLFLSTIFLLSWYACGPKFKSQSELDTPEYHYKAGMRYLEDGNYSDAVQAFDRAVGLNKKFALGWSGLGLAHALNGNPKEAYRSMEKGLDRGKKNADVHVLAGRTWIALKETDNGWFKNAKKEFEKAIDLKKNHEAATHYLGTAYLYHYDFSNAEGEFKKVVNMKGELAGKADEMWELSQKIVRAQPGTDVGKKIALHFEISRADLSALLIEELKLSEIFERMIPGNAPAFQTPQGLQTKHEETIPSDVKNNWATRWITESIRLGIMDTEPDGKFYPDSPVNRGNFAQAIARILVAASRDPELETRYFGENPSRFADVASSHYAYPAMALCAERGILQAELLTGKFNPEKSVPGADALLAIRQIQSVLRLTF